MNKSIEDQLISIKDIMSNHSRDYFIKGNTYPVREIIKSWAGYWVTENKCWRIDSLEENDPALKAIKSLQDVWLEEVK